MWIWIGVGVFAFLAFMFVMFVIVPKKMLDKVQTKLEERIKQEVPADQIVRKDTLVISFGVTSRGVTQGRGNGALVLTPTHLRWLQYTPHSSDVTIPLAGITEVTTKGSHLGKSYGKPLLYVGFTDGGKADSMAWFNTDVSGWIKSIEDARGQAKAVLP